MDYSSSIRRPMGKWFVDHVGEPDRLVTVTEFMDEAVRLGRSVSLSSNRARLRNPYIVEYYSVLKQQTTWCEKTIRWKVSTANGVSESTVRNALKRSVLKSST
jgi:hypothetical protein